MEFAEITRLAARSSTTERNTLLVDARPAASYESGHIPSSVSLAFPTSLLQNPAGFSHVRQPEKLRKYIEATLGKETSDHILAGTNTVVNSKALSIFRLLIAETDYSMRGRVVGCYQLGYLAIARC